MMKHNNFLLLSTSLHVFVLFNSCVITAKHHSPSHNSDAISGKNSACDVKESVSGHKYKITNKETSHNKNKEKSSVCKSRFYQPATQYLATVKSTYSTKPVQEIISVYKSFLDYSFNESFDSGMIGLKEENGKYQTFLARTMDKKFLSMIKDRYQNFVAHIEDLHSALPRIPKIIHQIWVGPHPFPMEAREWQESWQLMHPDWEYKLWTNEDVDQLDFENKIYYNQATNWGEKADILRYELIYRFGGLYVDVDEKCVKSFDVLHHTCDFYTAVHQLPLMMTHNNKFRINNAVIAAVPGHPILKHAVNEIKNNRHYPTLLDRSGPDYFTRIIAQTLDESQDMGNVDIILPANYFYPYGKRIQHEFNIKPTAPIYLMPETVAIHYYSSYWVKPSKE